MARGLVVYRGRSLLTGEPILAALTPPGRNRKTGGAVGLYIVPDAGVADASRPHPSVCPDGCVFRDTGGCYVNWSTAPLSVQRAYRAEPVAGWRSVREFTRGRVVRLGQAGDPAALPVAVLRRCVRWASGWTGYTHAWRDGRRTALRALCMASCESPGDLAAAARLGWRSYRVRPVGARVRRGELDCPSSRGVTCDRCRLCNGSSSPAPSVSIEAHGGAVAARVAHKLATG